MRRVQRWVTIRVSSERITRVASRCKGLTASSGMRNEMCRRRRRKRRLQAIVCTPPGAMKEEVV
jgi:hypothetical protein